MKRIISFILSLVIILSTLMSVPMVNAQTVNSSKVVTGIEYTGDKLTVNENENGRCIIDSNGNFKYYKYEIYNIFQREGSKILVSYDDNTSEEYVWNRSTGDFVNSSGQEEYFHFYDNQDIQPWGVGKDNNFIVEYKNISTSVPVEIIPSSLDYIEYTPIEPIKVIENSPGHFNGDHGENYYQYNVHRILSDSEANLLVHYKDGSTRNLHNPGGGFYDDNNNWIGVNYEWDFRLCPWKLGKDNFAFLVYGGKIIKIPVEVIKNPYESIEFIPVEPVKIMENTGGYMNGDYYLYDLYNVIYKEGNRIVLNRFDGIKEVYSCVINNGPPQYVDENNAFDLKDIDINDNQNRTPWTVGNNTFQLEIFGLKANINVEIYKNDLQSIEFVPSNPITFIENTNGNYTHGQNNNGFYIYNVYDLVYEQNNKIILNYSNNNQVEYRYDRNYDGFVNGNGEKLENIRVNQNQYEKHWHVGTDNQFTLEVAGKSCTLNVEITESPVLSIDFIPVEKLSIIENTDATYNEHFQYYEYDCRRLISKKGNVININYKDGHNQTYTCDGYEYLNDNGERLRYDVFDDQYNVHWGVGLNNTFTLAYLGCLKNISVEIIKNPIKSIEYCSQSPIKINVNDSDYGYWAGSTFYYDANLVICQPGSYIKVNKNDGTTQVYNCNPKTREFVDSEGNILSYEAIANRYDNPWTEGKNNFILFKALNLDIKVNVELLPDKVDYYEFKPINKFEIYEYTHGYFRDDVFCYNIYDLINIPGNEIIAHYLDGTKETFIYSYGDLINGYISESLKKLNVSTGSSYENNWQVGSNEISIIVDGKPVTTNLDILPSNVIGLEYYSGEVIVYDTDRVDDPDGSYHYNYDISNLKFKVSFNDGSSKILSINDESMNFIDSQYAKPWTPDGPNYADVQYGQYTIQIPVVIKKNTIQNITIVKAPDITEYDIEFGIDLSGMQLKFDYIDGTSKTVAVKQENIELDTISSYKYSNGPQDWYYSITYDILVNGYRMYFYSDFSNDMQEAQIIFKGLTINIDGIKINDNLVKEFKNINLVKPFTDISVDFINKSGVNESIELQNIKKQTAYGEANYIWTNIYGFSKYGLIEISVDSQSTDKNQHTYTLNIGDFSVDYSYQHKFREEVIAPTCFREGKILHICDECGYVYKTDVKPKLEHDFIITVVEPTPNEKGYTNHKCKYCNYSYRDNEQGYVSDNSALLAVYDSLKSYDSVNYSADSFAQLEKAKTELEHLKTQNVSQNEIDNAVTRLLTLVYLLEPYFNVDISPSQNGNVYVSYGEVLNSVDSKHSILNATNVTLEATPNDGYEFVGWYETVTKRIFSTNNIFVFPITSNLSFEAKFEKIGSSTLIFANKTDQIINTVNKTTDEWNKLSSIADMLPEVPFSYGNTNGRWTYDEATVLNQLKSGNDVTIMPEYDSLDIQNPTAPSVTDKPVVNLYYNLNEEKQIGSFVMAYGVPSNIKIESKGVAFYYKKTSDFSYDNFILTCNNKMLFSQFLDSNDNNFNVVNVKNFRKDYTWVARAYVTYYDINGNLKTVYSNQINVVNWQEVL